MMNMSDTYICLTWFLSILGLPLTARKSCVLSFRQRWTCLLLFCHILGMQLTEYLLPLTFQRFVSVWQREIRVRTNKKFYPGTRPVHITTQENSRRSRF